MKSIKFLVATLALGALVACCSSEPKTFTGFITDATMNTVTVKGLTDAQTCTFTTEGADMTAANGLLIGAPVVVDYTGDLTAEQTAPAIKVATDATYAEAVGEWTMPDPINDSLRMGVKLMVEGAAQSVNMATMTYKNWELQGEAGKILLKGTSEGSGEPIEFTQTGVISKNAEGVYSLTIEGTENILTKE